MDEVLAALEASAVVRVLRSSFFLYPLLNSLHILAIATLAVSAALMDFRILGVGKKLATDQVVAYLAAKAA